MTSRLRIGGVPEHFNLPWKMAIAAGAFDEIEVKVEFDDYPGGTGAMNAALATGDLDAALVLTEGAVADILGGSENRLVSAYVDSPLIWGIHVAAASDIQVVAEIENRRYAISRHGSGSHLIAIVDAAERGFQIGESQLVVVANIEGARAALANGEADVFLWEKHMTQPLVDCGEFRRVGERAVPWPAFVVSARRDYLADHSAQLRAALDIVRGYAARLKNSDNAADLISTTYKIKLDDARSWLAHVEWSNSLRCPDDALVRVVAALQEQGVINNVAGDTGAIWHSL